MRDRRIRWRRVIVMPVDAPKNLQSNLPGLLIVVDDEAPEGVAGLNGAPHSGPDEDHVGLGFGTK